MLLLAEMGELYGCRPSSFLRGSVAEYLFDKEAALTLWEARLAEIERNRQ